jgi:hypothetical protein
MKNDYTARQLFEDCKKDGIKISINNTILTLTKTFEPGNLGEYSNAESDVSIIYYVPVVKSQSSTWGTTGDGIGGYVGCKAGRMVINRSSVKKTFLKELVQIMVNQ